MVTQQLIDYIKNQQSLGKSKEEITQALLNQGWQSADIDSGFASVNSGVPIPVNPELPRAKAIFNEAWAIYKNRFNTLIAINAIPLAIYAIFFVLGITVLGIDKNFFQTNSIDIHSLTPAEIIFSLIAAIILIYINIWTTVATLFAIKDQAEGISWKEAYKRSQGKLLAFFLTSLLMGLAIGGGLILLIIPGIIFTFWFSQTPYIVVEENLSNTAALARSKYYIKGRIGEVFGKLFYIGIITIGLYIILGIIVGILGSIFRLKAEDTSWVSNVFSIVWTPMVTVFAYQLYKHLKSTRP